MQSTIVILVGKSGSGKTSTMNFLKEKAKESGYDVEYLKLYTTRPKRTEDEDDGYVFLKDEEYKMNDYICTEIFNNWLYGVKPITIESNKVYFIATTPNTMRAIQDYYSDSNVNVISIFLNIEEEVLRKRLLQRDGDTFEIKRRLKSDKADFSDLKDFDFDIFVGEKSQKRGEVIWLMLDVKIKSVKKGFNTQKE